MPPSSSWSIRFLVAEHESGLYRALLALSLLASGVACASAKPGATTPNASVAHDARPACDAALPVTLAEARNVLAKRCTSCHSPNGMAGSDYDWTNEASLVLHRRNVAAQVDQGSMPPAGYPSPSAEERRTLVCWANGM
jgi:uncharacterized membrane protein